MQCRGLILHDDGRIVARPFEKFFSYDQLNGKVPDEPFVAFDKMDGSLGILYWVGDDPFISTRGSFVSEQAVIGTDMIQSMAQRYKFRKDWTYLFEIIYPGNRIVVNYGRLTTLVLLAIIETETGFEINIPNDYPFPRAERYDDIADLKQVLSIQNKEKEGFVLRFRSGQRVKVKFDEYKRLHRLLTGVSPKLIWEFMLAGKPVSELMQNVPDEFFNWVRGQLDALNNRYTHIADVCTSDFKDLGDRKKTAEYFKTCKHPDVLFSMLDGKDFKKCILKKIKPVGGRAFRCDIDL
jgi:hypothetical protein